MRKGHHKSFILGIIISIFFSITCMSIPVFAKDVPNGIWTDYAATDFAGGSGTADSCSLRDRKTVYHGFLKF